MSMMSPTERMALATERLDAWLENFDKLEDPIENELDDLSHFIDLLESGDHGALKGIRATYRRLRELWDERA